MPRPRIKITLTGPSAAALTTAIAVIETELVKRTIFDRPSNWLAGRIDDIDTRVLHIRYDAKAGADFVWSRLGNLSLAGGLSATLSYHQCSHDDATVTSCRDGTYVEVTL